MAKENYKGYTVEHDYDGDSDNFERFLIIHPNGQVIRREIYAKDLKHVLNGLPDVSDWVENNKKAKEEKKKSKEPHGIIPEISW